MAENIKTFKVATDASAYQQRLNNLDQAIASVKKNITYLDALNITDAVISKENFAAQVNALVPNSSLVINTEPFNENGENYNRGDIVLKDASDIVHHIPGQQGGLYYPTSVTQNGTNYNINYKFTPTEPVNGNVSVSVGSSISDPVSNITFSGLTGGSISNSFIYGFFGSYATISLNKDSNGSFIEPMVEFYFVDGSNNKVIERVEIDYSLEYLLDGDSAILKNPLPGTLYMKVK